VFFRHQGVRGSVEEDKVLGMPHLLRSQRVRNRVYSFTLDAYDPGHPRLLQR
jgi:hypothetical protein